MADSVTLGGRAPLIWTVLLTVLVMCIGPTLGYAPEFAGFLVFLPAAAAGVCTVRQTMWISLWTAFVTICTVIVEPSTGLAASLALAALSIGFGAFSVYLCGWRLRHVETAVRLQKAADAMQRHLLRSLPIHVGDTVLAGVHKALGDDVMTGGDVYDMVDSAHGVRVMIADVQGKGLGALGAAVAVVTAFREAAHTEASLVDVAEAMEQAVELQNSYAIQTGESERFVTAVVLSLGPDRNMSMVNCGHPLPYLVGAEGVRRVDAGPADVPLGLGSLSGPRTTTRFPLDHGQQLVLFSDGLDEGRSRDGTFFPLREHLTQLRSTPADDLGRRLWEQLQEFTGHRQQDDTTVLTLCRDERRSI
jgi:Serine phosphatase RsbU, regulator of sigma subunit